MAINGVLFFPLTKVLLTGMLVFAMSVGYGQERKIKKGNQLYDDYFYSEAIEIFEEIDPLSPDLIRKLAHCYELIGNTSKAEEYYYELVKEEGATSSDIYSYAKMLRSNSKYSECENWMDKFHELSPNDSRGIKYQKKRGLMERLQRNNSRFLIRNLKSNESHQDFGITYLLDKVVFTSSRQEPKPMARKWNWNGLPFLDLYSAEYDTSGMLINISPFHKKLNRKYHEGPASFARDGSYMVYTISNYQNTSSDGVIRLELYETNLENGEWKTGIPFHFSDKEYSIGHPTLTEDGNRLYFSSDMPGGYGETDLYVVNRDKNGAWGIPENLGPDINTEGSEMFPFIHSNGTLYFASDGHVGLGGLDIFEVHMTSKVPFVKNIGAPINSNRDDHSFIIDQDLKSGYFSSNRPGGKGSDDIYSFNVNLICTKEPCVTLDIRSSEGLRQDDIIYSWDMGDGNIVHGEIISYCYQNPGTYTAKLSTYDHISGFEERDIETVEISIAGTQGSYAQFDLLGHYEANEPLILDGRGSTSDLGDLSSFSWSIDDGPSFSNADSVMYTFDKAGKYEIRLGVSIKNEDVGICTDTAVRVVLISDTTHELQSSEIVETESFAIDLSNYDSLLLYSLIIDVVDKSTGEPLSNSRVQVFQKEDFVWYSKLTDDQGQLEVMLDRNINYRIVASKQEYSSLKVHHSTSSRTEIEYSKLILPLQKGDAVITQTQGSELAEIDSRDGDRPKNPVIKGNDEIPENSSSQATSDSNQSKNQKEGASEFQADENLSSIESILRPIYFDLDRSSIDSNAAEILDRIIVLLNDNPELVIEFGAHTDSRASMEYNMLLSKRRAVSTQNYLYSRGISKKRFFGEGYGETQLTNKCSDGVYCTERQHSLNRRTEFKIIKQTQK